MSALADTLVTTDAERASLSALRDATGETAGVMEGHCLRCFRLAMLLGDVNGVELDREVMLCASFLHDIGLYDAVSEGGVYTDEGAELAMRLAKRAGWTDDRARLCADACAWHHALTRQWDRGPEVEVLRLADRIEVLGGHARSGLTRSQVGSVFDEIPRAGFYAGLARAVWPSVRSRPMTLPRIFKR